MVGLVASILIIVLASAEFPALSVRVCVKLCVPSVVAWSAAGQEPAAKPLPVSEQEYATSTEPWLYPAAFAATEGMAPIEGAVASRLTVTELVAVPPALVAEQVNVVPKV